MHPETGDLGHGAFPALSAGGRLQVLQLPLALSRS